MAIRKNNFENRKNSVNLCNANVMLSAVEAQPKLS